jgi:hypothetical protein
MKILFTINFVTNIKEKIERNIVLPYSYFNATIPYNKYYIACLLLSAYMFMFNILLLDRATVLVSGAFP